MLWDLIYGVLEALFMPIAMLLMFGLVVVGGEALFRGIHKAFGDTGVVYTVLAIVILWISVLASGN